MYAHGPVSTVSDVASALFGAQSGRIYKRLTIINEGDAAGFWSIDGGATWARLSAKAGLTWSVGNAVSLAACLIKREAGEADLSAVYAYGE